MNALPLLLWVSPSFPIGAFSFSGGLEASVAGGLIEDADTLRDWILAAVEGGPIRADALAAGLASSFEGHDANGAIAELDDLVLALAGSPTRDRELRSLGAAFVRAAAPWWPDGLAAPRAYPVALGTLAGAHGIAPGDVAGALALATVTNAVAAAQRLLPLGQRAGIDVIASLEPALRELAAGAGSVTADDLFSAVPLADLHALRHPIIEPRLFRS